MQITFLDMSGELNLEPEDFVKGDLLVVFSVGSKENAGELGRKFAQFLYKEIKCENTDEGLLISESRKE